MWLLHGGPVTGAGGVLRRDRAADGGGLHGLLNVLLHPPRRAHLTPRHLGSLRRPAASGSREAAGKTPGKAVFPAFRSRQSGPDLLSPRFPADMPFPVGPWRQIGRAHV